MILGILNDSTRRKVVTYTYDAWGEVTSVTGTDAETVGKYNSLRYRGYYYDSETGMYYLQSRYYDPGYKRFINADEPTLITELTKASVLGGNLFAYCENNAVNAVDPLGTRTYFINGINNNSSKGIPDYATNFNKKLSALGVKNLRAIGIYKEKKVGVVSTVKGVVKVALAMVNVDTYTSFVISQIKEDLNKTPLSKGEQLNLIGYSGGGQVALNVMTSMKNKFNNCVLIGSPILKAWKSTTKVSVIYAAWDPLSWTIGYGFKSYFAGWFGHTSYFNKDNIDNVAKIVAGIIK
ncbi:MAG: RHS repeat-associated core domain-containing protein [Monoglobaceae bacterium]